MLTRRALIDYCLTFPGAYEDYPFDEDAAAPDAWTVLRCRGNRKSFALIFERNGALTVNLKCEPMLADLLRGAYAAVTPAYHMNKTHWNGVRIDGSIPEEEIFSWISASYELVRPKRRAKK